MIPKCITCKKRIRDNSTNKYLSSRVFKFQHKYELDMFAYQELMQIAFYQRCNHWFSNGHIQWSLMDNHIQKIYKKILCWWNGIDYV